jgi:hypothetical protein
LDVALVSILLFCFCSHLEPVPLAACHGAPPLALNRPQTLGSKQPTGTTKKSHPPPKPKKTKGFANEAATRELRRVIKPGGGLALLWNMEDGSKPWMRGFLDILEPWALKAGVPNYGAFAFFLCVFVSLLLRVARKNDTNKHKNTHTPTAATNPILTNNRKALLLNLCSGLGTHLAAIQSEWFAGLFDVTPSPAAHSALFKWTRPLTRAGAWLRVMSNSYIAALPTEVVEAEVRPAVDAWIAANAGRFAAPAGDASGGDACGAKGKGAKGGDEVAMFELVTEAFVCKRVG